MSDVVDAGHEKAEAPPADGAAVPAAGVIAGAEAGADDVDVEAAMPEDGAHDSGAEPTEPESPPRVFRVMDVMDVNLELPAQYPQVTLQEAEPPLRHLVFPIGLHEATGLAHALHKIATPRPLSHELFADVLLHFQIDVVAVRLVGRRAGTYLAELDLIGARGREVIACRPTDGLTLALRMPVPAPVLCDERLLEEDGDVEPG